ncbi:hypothetical protein NUW58_g3256 [Xylaria curta]|uniref:Uncharacterized protein n=1 Tax=Xylaria curta TaxID=42375 RepID=A0ACC1PBT4_9PEZI|nr:hypothetical protein NUW58_g3256 [Xylaria curta]
MAIHDDVPGLEVTVQCHRRPLPELEDPNSHDNDDAVACPLTTKYIECVDDTEFDIVVNVNSDYEWGYRNHVLLAATFVDGKRIREPMIRSSSVKGYDGRITRVIAGQEVREDATSLWSVRKFKFAAVKTIDDAQKERVESDLQVAKSLGTIEVRFSRAIEYGLIQSRAIDNSGPRSFELAEKSLKGKAVSHDALKRELIIPRSPSRSPTLANLTAAERDRLARERLNELRNFDHEKNVKRENKNTIIKREIGEVLDLTQDPPAPRPSKKSRLQDGREVDVIDLTDD